MIFLSIGNKTNEDNYSYCITEVSNSKCIVIKINVVNGVISSCQTFDNNDNKYSTILIDFIEPIFYNTENTIILLPEKDEDEITFRLVHGYRKDTGYIASLFRFILDLIEKSNNKNIIINHITSKYNDINSFYKLCKNYMLYRKNKMKEFESIISIDQFISGNGE